MILSKIMIFQGFSDIHDRKYICNDENGQNEQPRKRTKIIKRTKFAANRWIVCNRNKSNNSYFEYIGKNIIDTEVNKTYRILNVFQNAKYPDTYFFGYCDMSCQDLLQNIDYSTCSEVLQGENGFTIQV